jgi:tripartite-type tricarboxylate transporter receptor subunit TctC
MKDLLPVAPVNYSDLVMVIHPSVKANTLAEFIALAKANPGKLNYASSGPGTPYHMAGELFKALAGVEVVHIPHKGSGEARTSVMSGQVEMMLDAITTGAQRPPESWARHLGKRALRSSRSYDGERAFRL